MNDYTQKKGFVNPFYEYFFAIQAILFSFVHKHSLT